MCMIYHLYNTFQDIYLFIKGHLAQHQERSCKVHLFITFTVLFTNLWDPIRSIFACFSKNTTFLRYCSPSVYIIY